MVKNKGLYLTRSKAKVIDNRDPLTRGRVRVSHPLLSETVWIPYLQSPNQFEIPSVGDIVYIEADCGDFDFLVASGNYIKGKDENPDVPEEFKRTVPTNMGFYSPGGHLIEIDDGEATPTTDPATNNTSDSKKGIRITTSSGNKIHISDEDGSITIEISGDANITAGGNVNIEAGGSATVSAGTSASVEANTTATVKANATITLETPLNSIAPGSLVAANPINNDPITGIPLIPAGGVNAQ